MLILFSLAAVDMSSKDAQLLQQRLLELISAMERTTKVVVTSLDSTDKPCPELLKSFDFVKEEMQTLEKVVLLAKADAYPERKRLEEDLAAVGVEDLLPLSGVSSPSYDYDSCDTEYYEVDSDRETRYSVWN